MKDRIEVYDYDTLVKVLSVKWRSESEVNIQMDNRARIIPLVRFPDFGTYCDSVDWDIYYFRPQRGYGDKYGTLLIQERNLEPSIGTVWEVMDREGKVTFVTDESLRRDVINDILWNDWVLHIIGNILSGNVAEYKDHFRETGELFPFYADAIKSLFWKKGHTQLLLKQVCPNYGFVYVIKLGETGFYKIGRSNNPDRRIWKEISPVLPVEPEIILTIETSDMIELEKKLHQRFDDKRQQGEWFTLSDKDIKEIEEKWQID